MLPPNPASWLSTALAARYARHADEPGARVPLARAALLADEASALRAAHRKLVDEGVSPQAGATYLVGWFAGSAAEVLGLMLARTEAGLLLDADHLTYRLNHEGGWPKAIDVDEPRVLMPAGNPWAGIPGAVVVEDPEVVRQGAIEGLVAFSVPIIDPCRGLARVSRTGLWDEVADGLALVFRHERDVTQEMLTSSSPRSPRPARRGRPALDSAGPTPICSGASTSARRAAAACTSPARGNTPRARIAPTGTPPSWRTTSGSRTVPGEKRYCSTCRFRDPADVAARRTYWQELCHGRR